MTSFSFQAWIRVICSDRPGAAEFVQPLIWGWGDRHEGWEEGKEQREMADRQVPG